MLELDETSATGALEETQKRELKENNNASKAEM
jgi:hypothetical protein